MNLVITFNTYHSTNIPFVTLTISFIHLITLFVLYIEFAKFQVKLHIFFL